MKRILIFIILLLFMFSCGMKYDNKTEKEKSNTYYLKKDYTAFKSINLNTVKGEDSVSIDSANYPYVLIKKTNSDTIEVIFEISKQKSLLYNFVKSKYLSYTTDLSMDNDRYTDRPFVYNEVKLFYKDSIVQYTILYKEKSQTKGYIIRRITIKNDSFFRLIYDGTDAGIYYAGEEIDSIDFKTGTIHRTGNIIPTGVEIYMNKNLRDSANYFIVEDIDENGIYYFDKNKISKTLVYITLFEWDFDTFNHWEFMREYKFDEK